MSKVASLTPGLVAKKGQATPAVLGAASAAPPGDEQLAQPAAGAAPHSSLEGIPRTSRRASSKPSGPEVEITGEAPLAYYKSLTVKLDRSRYEALKRAGLQFDKKSQEIFVEALDAYLAKVG